MNITNVSTPGVVESAHHHRLMDAAQQFEGIFLQQMLKPLSEGTSEDKDADQGSDTYKTFASESVAKAIAAAGGTGVARHIVQQVERQAAKAAPKEVAEKDETSLKSYAGAPIQWSRRLP